jgi:hypothetical protein
MILYNFTYFSKKKAFSKYFLVIFAEKLIIMICIYVTFILSIWLYIYGYITKQYCFHPEESIYLFYHGFMHLISSIGHHLIIFY